MNATRSIFVTGAASGIGRETALLFADKGWFVGAVDVTEDGLDSLQREIGEEKCCLNVADVTDVSSMKEAVTTFAKSTGDRMDVLFNNAGIVRMGPNDEIPIEDQHSVVDVNLKGVLNCVHVSLPYLKNTPGAHIISMCSASAVYGIPELAVYSSTKHAVKALTEAFDIELEKHGIIVSDIMVPDVKTPLITDAPVKAFSVNKMGVDVEPAQVAATVWAAAHGSRLHWKMTGKLRLLEFLFWAFPFAKRSIIKGMTVAPNGK